MKTKDLRQSKNIEDRREEKPSAKKHMTSPDNDIGHKETQSLFPPETKFAEYIDGEFKKPTEGFSKKEFKTSKPTKPTDAQAYPGELRNYTQGKTGKVKRIKAGASNPATQKWKGK